jgi:hypothetical protein
MRWPPVVYVQIYTSEKHCLTALDPAVPALSHEDEGWIGCRRCATDDEGLQGGGE